MTNFAIGFTCLSAKSARVRLIPVAIGERNAAATFDETEIIQNKNESGFDLRKSKRHHVSLINVCPDSTLLSVCS